MACTVLAATLAVLWQIFGLVDAAYSDAIYLVVPHAGVLLWMLRQYLRASAPPGRIDGLMLVSLLYILWFGLIALLRLA